MRSVIDDSPRNPAFEYLRQIEALTAEIEAAMEAVGVNAMAAFAQSVSTQEELCAGLRRLAGHMGTESAQTDEGGARFRQTDSTGLSLARRIQLASQSLQAVSVTYAALLKHCGDSTRLFIGLCGTYTEHHQGSSAAGTERPKWFC
jgi:hypothetical protein